MKKPGEIDDFLLMCITFALSFGPIVFALWLLYKVLKGLFYLATQLIEKI